MIWIITTVYLVGFVVTLVMSFGLLCAIERITRVGNPLALEVIDWRGDGVTAFFAAIGWPAVLVAVGCVVLYRLCHQRRSKEVA